MTPAATAKLALVDDEAPQFIEERSHTYRCDDGPWLPGVTGLLKIQDSIENNFALERWQIRTAGTAAYNASALPLDQALDAAYDAVYEANRRGTRIHEGIDALIGDEDHIPTASDGGYWFAWNRFIRREQPKFIASEQYVIGNGFGGTFDIDAVVRGKRALIDTKTGAWRDKYRLQLAGYADAKWRASKKTGMPVERMPRFKSFYVLLLAADGSYELRPVDVDRAAVRHFRYLVKTHHELKAWTTRDAKEIAA